MSVPEIRNTAVLCNTVSQTSLRTTAAAVPTCFRGRHVVGTAVADVLRYAWLTIWRYHRIPIILCMWFWHLMAISQGRNLNTFTLYIEIGKTFYSYVSSKKHVFILCIRTLYCHIPYTQYRHIGLHNHDIKKAGSQWNAEASSYSVESHKHFIRRTCFLRNVHVIQRQCQYWLLNLWQAFMLREEDMVFP